MNKEMQKYLSPCEIINCDHPDIVALAARLKGELQRDIDIAQRCFEYVRDEIRHTWDFQVDRITCKASDVLREKTGYCYAKSHLLAALLRANNIPAGLCYQRLSLDGDGAPYCLHGLNAVYLAQYGWYRVDPRGNKEGIFAAFCPPTEKLAFPTDDKLEADIQGVWPQPLAQVVTVLETYTTCQAVYENLPDLEMY